jgi:hypothetical protein
MQKRKEKNIWERENEVSLPLLFNLVFRRIFTHIIFDWDDVG